MLPNFLIIGGTGFIGERVLHALSEDELQSSLVLHASPIPHAHIASPPSYKQTDLRADDPHRAQWMDGIERVIILSQPSEAVANNIVKMLDAAPRLRSILYVSSILLYPDSPVPQTEDAAPDPQSPYEAGKHREELLFGAYAAGKNISLCIARLSNVYGGSKSSGIISKMFHALEKNTTIQIHGDGTQERDYIFVDDIALALAHLLRQGRQHEKEIFNICTGHGSSLNEITTAIEEITGRKLMRTYEGSAQDKRCVVGDNMKIRTALPLFDPISLHNGLRKTYARFHEMDTR